MTTNRLVPLALFASFALLATSASAQGRLHKMFEAGHFQEVVDAVAPAAAPEDLYTAAQSYQKLGANDQARAFYQRLADRSEGDPWHFVGLSAQQLIDEQTDAALDSAREAVGR